MKDKKKNNNEIHKSKVSIFCTHAIEVLWLFLLVAVPLFFYLSFKTFDLPKTHLFCSALVLMLVFWLIKSLEEHKFKIRFNWLSYILIAYFIILVLASVLGWHPAVSWWGSYDRYIGLSAYVMFFIFSIFISWRLKNSGQIFRIATAMSIGALFVAAYGILQYYGIEFLYKNAGNLFAGGRVISTLGNALYLSGYLTVVAPFCFALVFINKKYYLKAFWLVVSGAVIYTIFLTGSRSGFVAVAVLFVLGLLLLLLGKRKLYFFIGLVLIVGIALIFYLNLGPILEALEGSDIYIVKRIASIFKFESITIQERLGVWQIAWHMILERPILGFGQEAFLYAFDYYYDPSFTQMPETWFDRAHNIVLDTAHASGFVGLVSLLTLLGGGIVIYLRNFLRSHDKVIKWFSWAGVLAIVGFFVHNQFMFEDVTARFILFFLLGIAIYLAWPKKQEIETTENEQRNKNEKNKFWNAPEYKLIYYAMVLAGLAFIVYFYVFPVVGDYYFNYAQSYTSVSQKDIRLHYLNKALYYSRDVKKYKYEQQMGSFYFIVAQHTSNESERTNNFKKSEEWYLRAHDTDPFIYHTLADLAQVYIIWSINDSAKLEKGQETFNRALELSPNRQSIYWDWGRSLIEAGHPEEGVAKYQYAVEMEPNVGRSYFELGKAYKHTDQEELAREAFDKARELGWARGSEDDPL